MITVCVATHNGDMYIKEQLDSILCQLSPNDEVVISDDGSTDSTLDVVRSYNDPRIKIFNKVHICKGMTSHYYVTMNFENALKHAKGDYIFLSDQDDVWCPNKVETCIKLLEEYDMVLHNLECVDGDLKPLHKNIYNNRNRFRHKNYFLSVGKHYGCALAFKKSLLQHILPFPKRLVLHDYWIGIIGEIFGNFICIDQPLTKYRIHENNTSGKAQKTNSLFYKLSYRLYTLSNVFIRALKLLTIK